ncbi:hypothetical protein PSACC_02338, partial [Paramicrosporidium saccamoebae]
MAGEGGARTMRLFDIVQRILGPTVILLLSLLSQGTGSGGFHGTLADIAEFQSPDTIGLASDMSNLTLTPLTESATCATALGDFKNTNQSVQSLEPSPNSIHSATFTNIQSLESTSTTPNSPLAELGVGLDLNTPAGRIFTILS